MALNLYTNRHHKTINLLATLQISEEKNRIIVPSFTCLRYISKFIAISHNFKSVLLVFLIAIIKNLYIDDGTVFETPLTIKNSKLSKIQRFCLK